MKRQNDVSHHIQNKNKLGIARVDVFWKKCPGKHPGSSLGKKYHLFVIKSFPLSFRLLPLQKKTICAHYTLPHLFLYRNKVVILYKKPGQTKSINNAKHNKCMQIH